MVRQASIGAFLVPRAPREADLSDRIEVESPEAPDAPQQEPQPLAPAVPLPDALRCGVHRHLRAPLRTHTVLAYQIDALMPAIALASCPCTRDSLVFGTCAAAALLHINEWKPKVY